MDHPDWACVQRWAQACVAGQCRYPTTDRVNLRIDGCPGYAGFAHLEDGVIVMRYRLCGRHLAWRRAEQRRTERRPTAKPGSGWREGE